MGTGRQRIPRPDSWHPGPPAPWEGRDLSVLADHAETLARIGRIAGRPAGDDVGDDPRLRPSAVLVPVVGLDGAPALVFTRRSPHLTHHKGEVSFPGGRLDPGETPVAAALREAHEEIALAPARVTVLGTLEPVTTWASNSAITPVIGRVEGAPEFVANASEVERVFTTSGRFDLLLQVACPNTQVLDQVLDQIGAMTGVKASESLIHLSTKIDRAV